MTKHVLHVIPVLDDNYVWLLENRLSQVVIIDPGAAMPVIHYLSANHLTPIAILLTHHHQDHIGGVCELQKQYPNLAIFGPNEINLPITVISSGNITVADMNFQVIPVPGHTLGHLAYYCQPYLFCGDTLFSAGCGRISEGTYQQMFDSINRLKALPDETVICPAHEYTCSNLKFASHLVPDDQAIADYYQQVQQQMITLPTTLLKEQQVNLFLRCDETKLQQQFNCQSPSMLFQFFRTKKDSF